MASKTNGTNGKRKNLGTVYLIHFEFPYRAKTGNCEKTVSHYLGWALDLDSRIADHRASRGARLIEIVNAEGIPWKVVRTWEGDRKLERKLKNRKKSRCLCPECVKAAEEARARAEYEASLQSSLSLFS
jgi:predicted GIY-YIG superfamily endonuclease